MLRSFEPVVNEKSLVIILGTMPGVMSLKKRQYYGHDRNMFWRIIYSLFDMLPDEDYENRKRFLLNSRIALWDVISSCNREGSLDSNIKNAKPNDIINLLKKFPGIKAVFFNGNKAYELYNKMISRDILMEYYVLPSTSPARTLPFEEKLSEWMLVRKVLDRLSISS
jgi:hypoxanthine-DNA glycosylase